LDISPLDLCVSIVLAAFEQTAGPFVKRMASASRGVALVEIARRLHDRLEIRARIERIEQLGCVRQQAMRALDRDPDIVLRPPRRRRLAG
jgi:hypothetical protein